MSEDTQLYHMLGRLEGKVDTLLSNQTRQEKRLDDFDVRLKTLEDLRAQGTGATRTLQFAWIAIAALFGAFAETIKGFVLR